MYFFVEELQIYICISFAKEPKYAKFFAGANALPQTVATKESQIFFMSLVLNLLCCWCFAAGQHVDTGGNVYNRFVDACILNICDWISLRSTLEKAFLDLFASRCRTYLYVLRLVVQLSL